MESAETGVAPWNQVSEPEEVQAEVEEPAPPPTDDILAERTNTTLMARWAHDTQARFVMDFIREQRLFIPLNTFLKKRIR